MTRVLILSATVTGRSTALGEHALALRAAGATSVDVVTFRPVGPLADGDAPPLALAPAKSPRPGHAERLARLLRTATFTSDRWTMARALRRSAAAVELVQSADVIYADLPAAVPAGWWAARANPAAFVTISPVDAADAVAARARA